MKKWLSVLIKVAISVALIWFLLDKVDLVQVQARLLAMDPMWLAAAVVAMAVQIGICVLRWHAVMVAIDAVLNMLKTAQLFFIGTFFNQTLPSSVGGDAVRIYKAYKEGLSISGAVNGVMLDRVATVLALVLLVGAMMPFFLPKLAMANAEVMQLSILALVAVALGGVIFLMALDRLPARLHQWRLVRGLGQLAADTRSLFLHPLHATKALTWSVLGHANLSVAVYFLARGLDLEVSVIDCLVLVPPVMLVTTLPISIAGWGVRELAMVQGFALIGVAEEGGLVLSLLFGFVILATSLPGGLVWLMTGQKAVDEDELAKVTGEA